MSAGNRAANWAEEAAKCGRFSRNVKETARRSLHARSRALATGVELTRFANNCPPIAICATRATDGVPPRLMRFGPGRR